MQVIKISSLMKQGLTRYAYSLAHSWVFKKSGSDQLPKTDSWLVKYQDGSIYVLENRRGEISLLCSIIFCVLNSFTDTKYTFIL